MVEREPQRVDREAQRVNREPQRVDREAKRINREPQRVSRGAILTTPTTDPADPL